MTQDAVDLDRSPPGIEEVHAVARGIATAVAPTGGITEIQCRLLQAITKALTDVDVDYGSLEPLAPEELAAVLEHRGLEYRQRIVHHMVLGELVLTPLPGDVADRVSSFASALGIRDDFVGIARRYAEGMLGLAWCDLRRNGFTERWDETKQAPLHTKARFADPFDHAIVDPELAARWLAFEELPPHTLGRSVWEMYRMRAFEFPGTPGGASAYLAQHDFVHVLADCGTNLEGEIETFSLIGRADPDPKGFAWLATVVGLFETGYITEQGVLQADVRNRSLEGPGMNVRLADAIRRGKAVAEGFGTDLLSVDYHDIVALPLDEARVLLKLPPKSDASISAGSCGVFEPGGMSEAQREAAAAAAAAAAHQDG